MKKYIFSILVILLGVTFLSSCEKDETKIILNAEATGGKITAPSTGDDYVLTSADSANYLIFNWTAPNYGFNAAISYTVQLDKEGNNFSSPINLVKGASGTSDSIMIYDLNTQLQDYAGTSSDFQIRVRSILSGENSSAYADTLYSDTITVSATPYKTVVNYASIYIPGAYQGWDPTTANPLYSLDNNGIYSGYVYFPDASNEFKVTLDKTWNDNYGDTGADLSLDAAGDNIIVKGAGYYLVVVNMNSLTYTVTKTDWGITGDFTGWADGADIPLNYDQNTGLLTATTTMTAGGIKFRANGAWNIDYGDTGADGILNADGDNITIAAGGTYTVNLNLNGPIYTYTVTAN